MTKHLAIIIAALSIFAHGSANVSPCASRPVASLLLARSIGDIYNRLASDGDELPNSYFAKATLLQSAYSYTLQSHRSAYDTQHEAAAAQWARLGDVAKRTAMLETLNTIAALGTFVVIATTAIAALMQLRHMRASNQLEGLLSVLARVEDANFNKWLTDTQPQLPDMLADPAYVRSVYDNTFDRNVAWLQLGNSYDWVGSLVKNRLIPIDAFLDVYSFRIVQAWELMVPMTVLARHKVGNAVWENFEFLYICGLDWTKKHGDGTYPKRLRRATLPPIEAVVPGHEVILEKRND